MANAILNFLIFISDGFEQGKHCMATFFDLSKAFDSVILDILIKKLAKYYFSKGSCELITSYLTKRKQFVDINSNVYDTLHIKHGVPQDSILDPILFLIYINDLSCFLNLAESIIYAHNRPYWINPTILMNLKNVL